jgi:hypothetical protein
MNWSGWRVYAERSIVKNAVEVFLMKHGANGCGVAEALVNLEFKKFGKDDIARDIQPLSLQYELAQQLIDELWKCGLRPSSGFDGPAAIMATERHLQDMQRLSWRLLDTVSPETKK